ncbi:unnamed protein product [Vicia faba]|uniref:Uncharacterized protein n=1 Tax=Vicia faba TaxID=3906 RepID=A0AAV1A6K9_VICFA|nr:unnamed protein product [Vicia faba]
MEPLLELFKPKFIPAPKVNLTLVVSEQEIQHEVTPPPKKQVISQSKIGTTSRAEKPSEYDFMPLVVLKTLEELKQKNELVRSCLDKQDEMFLEQAQTNTKIEGLFHVILSRLPPLPKTI